MGLLDNIDPLSLMAGGVTMMANSRGRHSRNAIPMGLDAFTQYQLLAQKQAKEEEDRKLRQQQFDMQKQLHDMQLGEYQRKITEQQTQKEAMGRLLGGMGNYIDQNEVPVESFRNVPRMPQQGAVAPDFGLDRQSITTMQKQAVPNAARYMQDITNAGYGDEMLKRQLFPAAPELLIAPDGTAINKNDASNIGKNFAKPEESAMNPNKPFMVVDGKIVPNKAYQDYEINKARAGATNIGLPKIDIKMGESVANQVGPMMKDARVATTGAIKMFDAADRIEKAIASGNVSSGPFASQTLTVKQLISNVSGGKSENIRQTRQVIKGLAQMAVEARKQLQGQGQVTENEAAAVAKADAGDINDLTVPELQDLVTLTKRAAHLTAKDYSTQLESLQNDPATSGLAKFYKLNNLDQLLKHNPTLPDISEPTAAKPKVIRYDKNGKVIP